MWIRACLLLLFKICYSYNHVFSLSDFFQIFSQFSDVFQSVDGGDGYSSSVFLHSLRWVARYYNSPVLFFSNMYLIFSWYSCSVRVQYLNRPMPRLLCFRNVSTWWSSARWSHVRSGIVEISNNSTPKPMLPAWSLCIDWFNTQLMKPIVVYGLSSWIWNSSPLIAMVDVSVIR